MTGQNGYAGKVLRVDLSSRSISHVPTELYADRFVGGRGIATRIYWDEVPPHISAFDPENRLIIVTGPLGGFSGLAGSMWQLYGKSPATIPEQFCYSTSGGHWGAHLKFAGYDAIVVQGKAERLVYLLIQDGTAEIKDAPHLWGKGAVETREILKAELGDGVKVLAIGPGGENLVRFANVLAENDASASSGFGAVMGSKGLKAIAVRGSGKVAAAEPDQLKRLRGYIRTLDKDSRVVPRTYHAQIPGVRQRAYACYGCISSCTRAIITTGDGRRSKRFCQSGSFYQERVKSYYGEYNDVLVQATRLCNEYGLDTQAVDTMATWLSRCGEAGILTEESTGIPLSRVGSLEFMETLVRKIALREGFGDILAEGTFRAADIVGHGAPGQITDYISKPPGQINGYDPRLYISTAIMYAMEPRQTISQMSELSRPVIHWAGWLQGWEGCYLSTEVLRGIARRFWGSERAVDFSTYEGKALAAKKVQDRAYAKECLVLCQTKWPITHVPNSEDHVGDPTIESKLLSAVTGQDIDERGFYQLGERVFNLGKAIAAREGLGGRSYHKLPDFCHDWPLRPREHYNVDALVPGKGGEIVSRKGAVVDRGQFEALMDEYYQIRGWDAATGLQTRAKLRELGLGDIVPALEHRGLVV